MLFAGILIYFWNPESSLTAHVQMEHDAPGSPRADAPAGSRETWYVYRSLGIALMTLRMYGFGYSVIEISPASDRDEKHSRNQPPGYRLG